MNCVAVLPLARSSAARTFSDATKGASGVAWTGVRVVFGCLEAAGAPLAVRRRELMCAAASARCSGRYPVREGETGRR